MYIFIIMMMIETFISYFCRCFSVDRPNRTWWAQHQGWSLCWNHLLKLTLMVTIRNHLRHHQFRFVYHMNLYLYDRHRWLQPISSNTHAALRSVVQQIWTMQIPPTFSWIAKLIDNRSAVAPMRKSNRSVNVLVTNHHVIVTPQKGDEVEVLSNHHIYKKLLYVNPKNMSSSNQNIISIVTVIVATASFVRHPPSKRWY